MEHKFKLLINDTPAYLKNTLIYFNTVVLCDTL